MSKGLNL